MPATPVKESRLPELHLPVIDRDEIVRALSEIRLPEVDLSKIQLPNMEMPDIDLSKIDIRRAVEDAAVRVGVTQRTRRRWPILAAIAVGLSLGAMTLLRRPAVRSQIEESAKKARARIEQMRLEREGADASLTVEEIEAAVGEAGSNGHDPVAVGPGTKTRRARAKVSEGFEDVAATASQAKDDLTSDAKGAVDAGTKAIDDATDAVSDGVDETVAAVKDATS